MAYKVIILYQLYMPSYFLGTFTEYPFEKFAEGLDEVVAYIQAAIGGEAPKAAYTDPQKEEFDVDFDQI